MRFQHFFCVFFIFIMCLLFINGQQPVKLTLRRKLHRIRCSPRRCLRLHARVPFP
ncbi:apelin receptor early endogenous ligand [Nannospalax galili]|uniref:Apelin receptor early endogenous ligand n=1 Tax=Nannospalax galili TaxID=1026970 RepID=A0A8C6WBU9_NANGA|nr:apelin receptor early endogenous ligand [Nannospalax galili]